MEQIQVSEFINLINPNFFEHQKECFQNFENIEFYNQNSNSQYITTSYYKCKFNNEDYLMIRCCDNSGKYNEWVYIYNVTTQEFINLQDKNSIKIKSFCEFLSNVVL